MNPPLVYMCSPSWTLLPPPSPYHPSGSSQCTSPKHPGDSFHTWYYTCFNAILPNLPTLSLSHRVHKTDLYISVSFAVSYTGLLLPSFWDFPCCSVDKESACNVWDLGLTPGLGRSPGEGNSYLLQYSGLENSMDCIVHEVAKSWTWLLFICILSKTIALDEA